MSADSAIALYKRDGVTATGGLTASCPESWLSHCMRPQDRTRHPVDVCKSVRYEPHPGLIVWSSTCRASIGWSDYSARRSAPVMLRPIKGLCEKCMRLDTNQRHMDGCGHRRAAQSPIQPDRPSPAPRRPAGRQCRFGHHRDCKLSGHQLPADAPTADARAASCRQCCGDHLDLILTCRCSMCHAEGNAYSC